MFALQTKYSHPLCFIFLSIVSKSTQLTLPDSTNSSIIISAQEDCLLTVPLEPKFFGFYFFSITRLSITYLLNEESETCPDARFINIPFNGISYKCPPSTMRGYDLIQFKYLRNHFTIF